MKTATHVHPYLTFPGNCEEAIRFYEKALGAQVAALMKYKDAPEGTPMEPGVEEKVMHVRFSVGDSVLMASDNTCGAGRCSTEGGFNLCIAPTDRETATRYFNALAEGGQITMPLGETFWATLFGIVTDRFGICWMINLEAPSV